MKYLLAALALALLLSSGCASQFTAKTTASYTDTSTGKSMSYESNKDEVGFDAEFNPNTGVIHVKVNNAGTPAAAIAAAAATSQILAQVLADLVPLLKAAAMAPK